MTPEQKAQYDAQRAGDLSLRLQKLVWSWQEAPQTEQLAHRISHHQSQLEILTGYRQQSGWDDPDYVSTTLNYVDATLSAHDPEYPAVLSYEADLMIANAGLEQAETELEVRGPNGTLTPALTQYLAATIEPLREALEVVRCEPQSRWADQRAQLTQLVEGSTLMIDNPIAKHAHSLNAQPHEPSIDQPRVGHQARLERIRNSTPPGTVSAGYDAQYS